MKNKNIIYISAIVIIAALSIAIFYNATRLKVGDIQISNLYSIVHKNDYTVLHLGKITKKDENVLKKIDQNFNVTLLNVDTTKEDYDTYLQGYYKEGIEYIVFNKEVILGAMEQDQDFDYYNELLNKYIFHIIPEDEIKYKVPSSATEFIEAAARKKQYTVAVFGYSDCSYCTLYKPVINEIASEYKLDIYYLEGDTFDGFDDVTDMKYKIPAKCTKDGKDTNISESFGAPTTLILKDGETVDCIRGYVPTNKVVSMLKEYKIIK